MLHPGDPYPWGEKKRGLPVYASKSLARVRFAILGSVVWAGLWTASAVTAAPPLVPPQGEEVIRDVM